MFTLFTNLFWSVSMFKRDVSVTFGYLVINQSIVQIEILALDEKSENQQT